MKIAAVFASGRNAHTTVESMLAAQCLRHWHTPCMLECAPGAAGFVTTSDRIGSVRFSRRAANGNWLVVTGVPIHIGGNIDAALEHCVASPLEVVVERLTQLDGAFAALFWDNTVRKVAIVTDILGMQPLYAYHNADVFALATDAKALTVAGLAPIEMDLASWGAFLSIKHPIAGRTLTQDVARVPAGSVLVFDAEQRTLTQRQYWCWPEPGPERLEDVDINAIAETFLAELKAYLEHHSHATLCLSGGFDSRLILAGLASLGQLPDAISLSHADELFDVDGRLAARMANLFGARFSLFDSDPSFYSSEGYRDYLVATEVTTPSLYLFIAQLCSKLKPEMEAVWEGVFPGCILYPVHQPPGGFDQYLKRESTPLDSTAWQAAERIFRPELVQQMRSSFSASLAEERSKYPDNEFGVSQFVVRNRTRHRIAINPLQVYSNDVLPFTPGLSKRFWALSAGIEYGVRAEHRLYRHLFDRFFPKALEAPAISGTTPYALNTAFDRDYLLARLGIEASRRPKIGAVLRLAGCPVTTEYWRRSRFVDEAMQEADLSHPDLFRSGAAGVCAAHPPYDPVVSRARELLFYWSSWRSIHTGSHVRPRQEAIG